MDSYLVDPATFPTSPRRSAPREPTHGHKRGEPSTSSQRSKESRPDIELGYSHTRFTAHSFTPPPDHGVRNDLTAAAGEYLGTLFFLYMAFAATQSALLRKAVDADGSDMMDNQTILYISLSFGMSLLVSAWVFFRISGAAFNPAVSLALWLIGGLPTRRFVLVVPAQVLGGITAAGLAKVLSIGPLGVENGVAPGVSNGQAISMEMLTTALLCFTVLFTAAEKSKGTFLAPVVIGLAVFVGHLASVGYTGAGINPARTLGPSVINLHFPQNCWVYYIGPATGTKKSTYAAVLSGQLLGAVISSVAYAAFKHVDYSEAVAGIDTSDKASSQDITKAPLLKVIGYPAWKSLNDPASDRLSRTMSADDGLPNTHTLEK